MPLKHFFARAAAGLAASAALVSAVSAEVTLKFNDLGMGGSQSVLIFNQSGGLVGEYNTSALVRLNDSVSFYTIQIQPSPINIFTDPMQAIPLVQAYITALLPWLAIAFAVLGVWLIFFRRS